MVTVAVAIGVSVIGRGVMVGGSVAVTGCSVGSCVAIGTESCAIASVAVGGSAVAVTVGGLGLGVMDTVAVGGGTVGVLVGGIGLGVADAVAVGGETVRVADGVHVSVGSTRVGV